MAQTDQLPVYPANIQGELRLILQNKDLFLLCYKYLEDYRRLSDEQNRIITKEFIEEQIKIGEDEIDELKKDYTASEAKLSARLKNNESLLGQLTVRGMTSYGDNSRRNICRSPTLRKCNRLQVDRDLNLTDMTLFENIALAIEEIQKEIRDKLKPLCDFLRDLFYLQLHFTLVLTQVCNYCMPLITENIGLIDRIFFWADRPEFELVKKSGEIADRLKDIYTRTQSVLTLLVENVMFLQNKVELQKNLERKFQERLELQQLERDKILRKIHSARQDLDILDEENDRLVGILVKLDPKYVGTDQFNELAEYSVRRNYLEGRLTPEGFQARQMSFTPPPGQFLAPMSNRPRLSRDNNDNSRMQENASHTKNNQPTAKVKKKRHSNSRNHEMNKENHTVNDKKKKHRHPDPKTEPEFLNSTIIGPTHQGRPPESNKLSIKDKLLSKTKGIFDSAFRKSSSSSTINRKSNDYVKLFEGEILAELSQFSATNNSRNGTNTNKNGNSWDASSPNLSLERSLKRKYDAKEAELFKDVNSKTRVKVDSKKSSKYL